MNLDMRWFLYLNLCHILRLFEKWGTLSVCKRCASQSRIICSNGVIVVNVAIDTKSGLWTKDHIFSSAEKVKMANRHNSYPLIFALAPAWCWNLWFIVQYWTAVSDVTWQTIKDTNINIKPTITSYFKLQILIKVWMERKRVSAGGTAV